MAKQHTIDFNMSFSLEGTAQQIKDDLNEIMMKMDNSNATEFEIEPDIQHLTDLIADEEGLEDEDEEAEKEDDEDEEE